MTPAIHIRTITEQDAAIITEQTMQLGYLLSEIEIIENIRQILSDPNHTAFVAYSGGEVIGWMHVFKAFRIESKSFVEIGGLVVDVNHRKQGIGKMLVAKAGEWAKENHIGRLRVRCNTKRVEAHQFYRALGFTESKEQKIFETNL